MRVRCSIHLKNIDWSLLCDSLNFQRQKRMPFINNNLNAKFEREKKPTKNWVFYVLFVITSTMHYMRAYCFHILRSNRRHRNIISRFLCLFWLQILFMCCWYFRSIEFLFGATYIIVHTFAYTSRWIGF